MSISIAILDDYGSFALGAADWSRLHDRASVQAFSEHFGDPDELVKALCSFEVVVAMRERSAFPKAVLSQLPNLKLLITTGMANASIDMAAARELGIVVAGTGNVAYPTAELTIGLMVALTRGIVREDASMRAGNWQVGVGPSLSGLTLGIIGLGRLGRKVAQVAQVFEMTVLAWSENLTSEAAGEVGVERVSKAELFERADIVTIHTRLSARTTGIVGRAELDLLGPAGYLINTSRGPIVEEEALVSALSEARIAGAALDVYWSEPLPADHRLRALSNTVLTPHLGYATSDTFAIYFRDAIEDIETFLDGSPVRVLNA